MKGLQQISSLRNIKSIHSVGGGSIPKVQRSAHLDLYILKREKDRLEKEVSLLEKRREAADSQLSSVTGRIRKLQKETPDRKKKKTHSDVHAGRLRSLDIKY